MMILIQDMGYRHRERSMEHGGCNSQLLVNGSYSFFNK
jgi:hypothetical protein